MGFIGYFVKLIHIPMSVRRSFLCRVMTNSHSRNNILVYVLFRSVIPRSLLIVFKWRSIGCQINLLLLLVVYESGIFDGFNIHDTSKPRHSTAGFDTTCRRILCLILFRYHTVELQRQIQSSGGLPAGRFIFYNLIIMKLHYAKGRYYVPPTSNKPNLDDGLAKSIAGWNCWSNGGEPYGKRVENLSAELVTAEGGCRGSSVASRVCIRARDSDALRFKSAWFMSVGNLKTI